MTRSYRTDHPRRIAQRRIARDAGGNPILPRIIERRPRPGDVHPIPKRVLRRMLADVPLEFLHGLGSIDLRARKNDAIGKPLATYHHYHRTIVLYSLPFTWSLPVMPRRLLRSLLKWHATVDTAGGSVTVTWPEWYQLGFWYFDFVLCHELGHHFSEQYRQRYGRVDGTRCREAVADLRGMRLWQEWWGRLKAKRDAKKRSENER